MRTTPGRRRKKPSDPAMLVCPSGYTYNPVLEVCVVEPKPNIQPGGTTAPSSSPDSGR